MLAPDVSLIHRFYLVLRSLDWLVGILKSGCTYPQARQLLAWLLRIAYAPVEAHPLVDTLILSEKNWLASNKWCCPCAPRQLRLVVLTLHPAFCGAPTSASITLEKITAWRPFVSVPANARTMQRSTSVRKTCSLMGRMNVLHNLLRQLLPQLHLVILWATHLLAVTILRSKRK